MTGRPVRRAGAIVGGAGVVVALLVASPSTTSAAPPPGVAPGGPGSLSHFDLARKDCVGTARTDSSKVWFTVADGVLSDVYEPTIDNTNVHTLQYVVTDGHSFTDLQTRDLTYTVSSDRSGMECTVAATSAAHGYTLTTRYVTDPRRDSVVMHTSLSGRARRRAAGCTRGSTRSSTATAVAARPTVAPTAAWSPRRASRSSPTPARSARRPTATTPCPPSWP